MFDKEYNEKKQKLNDAKAKLKAHFVGIDEVIDRVFSNIEVWYLMPELLTRPIIINLWGLTGSGKTDLVRRLAEELDFEDKFVEVQLAGGSGGGYFSKTIASHLNGMNIRPEDQSILLLDEIQRFSHKDDDGHTEHVNDYQDIWMLLSDGQLSSNTSYKNKLMTLLLTLEYELESEDEDEDDDDDDDDDFSEILSAPKKKKNTKKKESKYMMSVWSAEYFKEATDCDHPLSEIMTWDTHKKMEVVKQLLANPRRRADNKYKNLLIFICGNLDKAYQMSEDVAQTNIDADVLSQFSKNISVVNIKDCLLAHFKPEQIARFGNNHVIYPSLSKDNFNEIINHGLNDIAKRVETMFDVKINFDDSVKKAVYRNGVYPAQGVRPLFSTISSLVEATVPHFLMIALVANQREVTIFVDEQGRSKRICAEINGKLESKIIHLDIDAIIQNSTADEIARVSVHEAGHAIVYALRSGLAPSQVICNTTKLDSNGFVIPHQWCGSKEHVGFHIQTLLAGSAAEAIVFGDDWKCNGCSHDFLSASTLAGSAVRQWGFDENLFFSTTGGRIGGEVRGKPSVTDDTIEKILHEHMQVTISLIKEHKDYLIAVVRELQVKQRLLPEEFVEISKPFVSNIRVESASYQVTHEYADKLANFIGEKKLVSKVCA